MFVTKGQVDPPSYDSQGERLVWVARELMCFTEPRSVFFESQTPTKSQDNPALGIQSPSDNGNGTSIPCLGGDSTPQSSSNKVIGSLGQVPFHVKLTWQLKFPQVDT